MGLTLTPMLTFFASVLLKLLSDREQNKWKTCEKSLYQKLFSNRDFPLIWRCGKTVLLSNPQYVRKAHYAVKRMSKSRINLLIFCFIKSITKCWRKKYWFLSYHSILLLPISQRCWNFSFYELSNLMTQTHTMSKVYRVTDPDTDSVQSFLLFFYLTDLTPA